MWGSILDPLMAKYHWTLDYALWEVSYVNITMLQVDEYMLYDDLKEKKAKNGSISKKGTDSLGPKKETKNLSYGELISIISKNI